VATTARHGRCAGQRIRACTSHPRSCAVRDGNAILLVTVDVPDRDIWGTPGGMLEAGEDPTVGAARELHEETTLLIDWPDPYTDIEWWVGNAQAALGHR